MKKKQSEQHKKHFSAQQIKAYISGDGSVELRDRFSNEADNCSYCKRRLEVAQAEHNSTDDHSSLFPEDFDGNHSGLHVSMDRGFDVARFADALDED